MTRVARGRVFRVTNKDRRFGSAENYNFINVQDCRSEGERQAHDRDAEGEEFSYTLPLEYDLLFTDEEINVARTRALKNQEDLLKKSFLTDLTDDL
jgi:hypothetical protein